MGYGEMNSRYKRNRASIRRRKRRNRRMKILGIEVIILILLAGSFWVVRGLKGKEVIAPKKSPPETFEEFVEKKGLVMDDYPAELLELYDRNPEAKDFVWEYPLKKDEEPKIDLSEYKNSDSMPLFMQWDQRWGYHQYSGNVMRSYMPFYGDRPSQRRYIKGSEMDGGLFYGKRLCRRGERYGLGAFFRRGREAWI